MNTLEIKDLTVEIEGTPILKNFSLSIPKGEVHALMGPNGSGKSTLAKVLAGQEDYDVLQGEASLDGQDILGKAPDEISRQGLFLAFQYPSEIPGVSIANFIRASLQAHQENGIKLSATEFYKKLYATMDTLHIDNKFSSRSLNEGFSGGEKKRCEILQLMMLKPRYAILDETDSGLDIDALKIVARGINSMRGPEMGGLVITHYQRLLDYIIPDKVHIMNEGAIVYSGDKMLAQELEAKGYDWVKTELSSS